MTRFKSLLIVTMLAALLLSACTVDGQPLEITIPTDNVVVDDNSNANANDNIDDNSNANANDNADDDDNGNVNANDNADDDENENANVNGNDNADDNSNEIEFSGTISQVGDGFVVVAGRTVFVSNSITAQLRAGMVVKVHARVNNGVISALEIELK